MKKKKKKNSASLSPFTSTYPEDFHLHWLPSFLLQESEEKDRLQKCTCGSTPAQKEFEYRGDVKIQK